MLSLFEKCTFDGVDLATEGIDHISVAVFVTSIELDSSMRIILIILFNRLIFYFFAYRRLDPLL
jgi:hypothetical protein